MIRRLAFALLALTLLATVPQSGWAQFEDDFPLPQFDPGTGLWLHPVIVRRHDVDDADYIANTTHYPFVGRMSRPGASCTCTLIAPDWILTAAHCLTTNPAVLPSDYSFNIGGQSRVGAQVIPHPEWTGSLSAGNDIALVRLNAPITAVAPALLNFNMNEVGMLGTYVGRGRTGTGLTGHTTFDNVMRAGTNMQDVDGTHFGWNFRVILSDFDNPNDPDDNWFGSPIPTALEAGLAPGDSGGGMFVDFGFGPRLAGVHSFISSQDGSTNMDYGDMSGSMRVAPHYAWITSFVSVPEPSTWALIMIGGAAAGASRLRRKVVSADATEE